MDERSRIIAKIESLSNSKFRGSFHLNKNMIEYVNEKGMVKIQNDALEIINKRLKPREPKNDGKQTPMKQVHPVFIAQHACGFCCRNCLKRIHNIEKNKELTAEEVKYIVKFIMIWIKKETNSKKC